MRFLFVHQNFPGQFLHIVRHLVRAGPHEVVFITEENANRIAGVKRITYRMPPAPGAATYADAQDFEAAVIRAAEVKSVAVQLRSLGFQPDIIIGHHGWGEMLNLPDVWPGVPLLGYQEFYYRSDGLDVGFDAEFPVAPEGFPRVRAKNAVGLLALNNPGHGQTPTRFQHSTFPDWAQARISVLTEGVDLDRCIPDPGACSRPFELAGFRVEPGEMLVTYVARDLEPYRGFHVMMRALPRLLRLRRDLKVVLVGGDGVSYGPQLSGTTWREYFMREVGSYIDPARVSFPGRVEYADYLRLLQRSDAHVYLTYPFVASWSLREALACGCAIVASDTAPVHEFVADGDTGLLTPCLDPAQLALRVQDILDGPALGGRLRTNARAFAERALRMDDYIADYQALIGRVMAGGL